ncbi:MAG: shikimate dehydrogenase [Planctomycetota bacterium]
MTHLCVSLTGSTPAELSDIIRELPPSATAVELRIDHLHSPLQSSTEALKAILNATDRTVIATNRPARAGGKFQGDEKKRLNTLREAAETGADYIDVEMDSSARLGRIPGNTGRIVSCHDFQKTPEKLFSIYRDLKEAGADVAKIAVRSRTINDTGAIFNLMERCTTTDLIAIGMGEKGICTRVLAPKFDTFMTFASAKHDAAAAPGQVPCKQMDELYHFSSINPATRIYGVVANPVAHSMSPAIHNAAFTRTNLNAVYLPFKVDNVESFFEVFEHRDLRGLSVTIPHKQTMLSLMDEVDELSRTVGALNTVDIRNGRRLGSNTDAAAALQALQQAADEAEIQLEQSHILIVGAGGAGRTLAHVLADKSRLLSIANRTVERAETLAGETGGSAYGLDQLNSLDPDVLINTTPVGMHPDVDRIPVPPDILRPGMVVFDAIYNPIQTRLMREAEEAGCVIASGFDWFVSQAAAQFQTWTDRDAPRELMANVVRDELSGQK